MPTPSPIIPDMPNTDVVTPSEAPRLRSVRSARRLLEETLAAHRLGRVTAQSLTAVSGGLRVWMELFLAERELTTLGLDVEPDEHPLGRDGGHLWGEMVDTPALVSRRDVEMVDAKGETATQSTTTVQGFALHAPTPLPRPPEKT